MRTNRKEKRHIYERLLGQYTNRMESLASVETALEFPISLETVLSLSLNFENLKLILEYLLKVLQGHESQLKVLQTTPVKEKTPSSVSVPTDSNQASELLQGLKRRIKKRKVEIKLENEENERQNNLIEELVKRMSLQEEKTEKAEIQIGKIEEIATSQSETLSEHEKRINELQNRKFPEQRERIIEKVEIRSERPEIQSEQTENLLTESHLKSNKISN